MEAVILCGGMGTRLRSMVSDVPKPMALINGKPFLEILLEGLLSKGVSSFVLSVGYLSHVVINHFGNQFHGIPIRYVIEDQPLGTGGAIKLASSVVESDQFFVCNGDSYLEFDMKGAWHLALNEEASVIVVKKTLRNDRYGQVLANPDGIIYGFLEKDELKGSEILINGGVYILQKKHLSSLDSYPKKFSFEKDFLPNIIGQQKFMIYEADGRFIDIGIPSDYIKSQSYLSDL